MGIGIRYFGKDLNLERVLLGALLACPELVPLAAGVLKLDDFSLERHRQLFSHLLAAQAKGVPADAGACLDLLGEEDPEFAARLRGLFGGALRPAPGPGPRAGGGQLGQSGEGAPAGVTLDEALREARQHLASLHGREESRPPALPYGFRELDQLTGGLHGGELVVLASRPGAGKTSLALNILRRVARSTTAWALFFTQDLSARQVALRLLAADAGVDKQKLRSGYLTNADFRKIDDSIGRLGLARIHLDAVSGHSVRELRRAALRLAQGRRGEQGLILVDYVQLVGTGAELPPSARTTALTQAARALKDLAVELDLPVLALARLGGLGERSRGDHRPRLEDLRGTGALERLADVVLLLYRGEVYEPDLAAGGGLEVIVARQPRGPAATVRLEFRQDFGQVDDSLDPSALAH